MILLPNASVTFERIEGGVSTTTDPIPVMIVPLSLQERLRYASTEFAYTVCYPIDTAINGVAIVSDDIIHWSGIRGGQAAIQHPAVHLGFLPYASAVFAESQ